MSKLRNGAYSIVLLALVLLAPPRDGLQGRVGELTGDSGSVPSQTYAVAGASQLAPVAQVDGINDQVQFTNYTAQVSEPASQPTAARGALPLPSASATAAMSATAVPAPTIRSAKDAVSSSQPGDARTARLPILMYHYIRLNPDPADRLGFNLSVTPDNFAAQMTFLADRGYKTIDLADLASFLLSGLPSVPPRSVAITFDDGYRDAYEAAFPVLRRLGFRATVFMITGKVGHPGYLSWDQLRELSRAGMRIGAHTVNHPDLVRTGAANALREISESKAALERELGLPVTLFSYPSGSYDSSVVRLVRDAGYEAAVTVKYGLTHGRDDLLTLARVRVSGGQSLASLASSGGIEDGSAPITVR